ncbi:MAG: hypothetical protein K6357_01910 [Elusimicrobiota bacterium]
MNVYRLYDNISKIISSKYSFLGVNKRREIERLCFEIAKLRDTENLDFLPEYKNYTQFKNFLLKLRYDKFYNSKIKESLYLPKLEIEQEKSFVPKKNFREVKEIIVEKECLNSKIFANLSSKYPAAKVIHIDSFKDVKKSFDIEKYNRRSEKIYIFREEFDFIKRCPCTKRCVSCGYYVINLSFGCPLECEYCFLQGYQNFDGISFIANIDDFIRKTIEIFKFSKTKVRIGSGEFADSLAYDDITDYSIEIIKAFRGMENLYFEFKTKTVNLENLFKVSPSKNIVIAYSLNPQKIIDLTEHYTTSFKERLLAIKKIIEYGYSTAFHFDPLINIDDWERLYKDTFSEIFSVINPEDVRWISLGTFRFKPETKKVIENRFPDNIILDEEMFLDFDGKLRYPYELRKKMYREIINILKGYKFPLEKVYLCMEDEKIWRDVGIKPYFRW